MFFCFFRKVLKVTFDAINLLPQSQSEEQSQGFFSFNIRTKRALSAPDFIRNRAGIYFDYNPVVLTDYALTKVDRVSKTEETNPVMELTFRPNPASDRVELQRPESWQGQTVLVTAYSATGVRLFQRRLDGQENGISLADCPPGVMMIYLECDRGKGHARLVKQ